MARQAKNAIKQRGELVNAITQDAYKSIEATILGAPKSLNAQFEKHMASATILPNTGLSVKDLFDKYFDKEAPFEGNEKKKWEFPDAAVIMSIKQHIKENPSTSFHVVTDDNGWHNALKDTTGITLYFSLSDLLTKIAEEEDLYSKINQYMESCIAELRGWTEDWFVCQDWSTSVEEIDSCIECDELVDIYITAIDLVSDGIEYIDREDEFAAALCSGVVAFYLGFDYIDHTNEVYDREDRAYYNTIYGKGAVKLKVSFTGSVTVLIPKDGEMELNSTSFDEVTIEDVEIVDYKLTPYRNEDDPYFDVCPDCGQPIGIHNDGGNGFCTNCSEYH